MQLLIMQFSLAFCHFIPRRYFIQILHTVVGFAFFCVSSVAICVPYGTHKLNVAPVRISDVKPVLTVVFRGFLEPL
jgi:hypothetical protein